MAASACTSVEAAAAPMLARPALLLLQRLQQNITSST